MNKRNTMKQKTLKKSKLERDSEGRPKIILNPLERTVVSTPTQKKDNILMQVYECGGWKWASGNLPTHDNYWGAYEEKTCISVENRFIYGHKKIRRKEGYKVISTKKFYKIQKITPDMLREVNSYFEITSPVNV